MAPPPVIGRSRVAPGEAVRDFAWPDFDRWQAFFTAGSVFPARWDGLHAAPASDAPAAEAYLQRKLALFSEWRDMCAHRTTVVAHFARQGIRARIERQDAGPVCRACDPFHAREVGPGLDTLPPFHPGCRCVLLAVRTAPTRRRRKSYERPRSGAATGRGA